MTSEKTPSNGSKDKKYLSKHVLDELSVTKSPPDEKSDARPRGSLIELMNWTKRNFGGYLKDQDNLNSFVNNAILIDGQFMHFATENNIKVECLYKDSFVSWNSENNERYFTQGVFKINYKKLEFLHCALYHKGNQNEDEISFFNIMSSTSFDDFVSVRNSFEKWMQERDRSNLHIKVVDGDDLAYNKDNKWDDLFLPKDLKSDIKKYIESFLNSKSFYEKSKIPWKTGCILHGLPGNGKTSLIRTIISEYDFKPITITATADDSIMREAFAYAETQSPSLLYFEDLDSLLETNVAISTFLNLMDGISAKNGLFVIATANNFKKLRSSITDRPSRFDRKFEIMLPNKEMAHIYLNKWFGKLITKEKRTELVTKAVNNKFSYAYLKELYVSSMFEALSKNKASPTLKDIDVALNRLIKDKNMNSNEINMDKFLQ